MRSAGISLNAYFGPLQASPLPAETVAGVVVFEIPIHPEPEIGPACPRVPVDVIGTFVNGLPIYNQFEPLSWNGANLWHYDAVAYNSRPELTHPAAPGLLEQLAQSGSRPPPLIGFALKKKWMAIPYTDPGPERSRAIDCDPSRAVTNFRTERS